MTQDHISHDRITLTLHHLVYELDSQADRILRSRFGMTFSQFLFLVNLEAGANADISMLAERIGVSRAAVSKRLPWFLQRDLVYVADDPANKRRVMIGLTAKGGELVERSGQALELEFSGIFASFEGVDLEALNRDLNTVLGHLSKCT
jgi:DNA-binding MarR family transcriptional regulator